MIDVNAGLAGYHAYQRDRQQRRQDTVDAAAREAGQRAPDPTERVKAEHRAALDGVVEFDASEPELSYDQWKASA
jgi:hypothetical protein